MKKLLYGCLALLCASPVLAQIQVQDTLNQTTAQWRAANFQCNLSTIPNGLLAEYSLAPFAWQRADGLANDDDTLTDGGLPYSLLDILRQSRVHAQATPLPDADSLYALAQTQYRSGSIPFALLCQPYYRIRPAAFAEGLLQVGPDNIAMLDGPNAGSASPWQAQTVVACAPLHTSITQFGPIAFSFPAALWQAPGITSLTINFDDGAGPRTITPGTHLSIYYATEGYKTLTTTLSTPEGPRTTRCRIWYQRPAQYSTPLYQWDIDVPAPYTSEAHYLYGSTARTTITSVGARTRVLTGCDGVFDKPVIIVEGFDPEGSLDLDELVDRFEQQRFIATLQAYGYDIVLVDFKNNGTLIENNAAVLEAVIKKVNETKTGTFKSHVIGFSMGGLIARWCLRTMENKGLPHQVANYFSYDAPHQGANIPLGLQYLFKEILQDMAYLRFNSQLRKVIDANESLAARQMLVTRASYTLTGFNYAPAASTLDPLRAQFAQRLQALGYPQQCTNYGIAFGRGRSTPGTKDGGNGQQWGQFGPGSNIFSSLTNGGLFALSTAAYAVPDNGATDFIARYRFAGIAVWCNIQQGSCAPVLVLRLRNIRYTGQYPYDDAPGGYERTQAQFNEGFNFWQTSFLGGGIGSLASTNGHNGHNFISTASALDLQNQGYGPANYWQSNQLFFNIDDFIQNPGAIGGGTLSNPALSPFAAVATATASPLSISFNLFHNQNISTGIARFIVHKILNAVPDINCETTNFCDYNPVINGPLAICNQEVYRLSQVFSGVSYRWSLQNPATAQLVGGQGTPDVVVKRTGDGVNQLILEVTNSCGTTRRFEKPIHLGSPLFTNGIYTSNGSSQVMKLYEDPGDENPACAGAPTTATTTFAGSTAVTWTKLQSFPANLSWSQGNGNLQINFSALNQWALFRVRGVNACGAAEYIIGFKATSLCSGRLAGTQPLYTYQLSPNPAQSEVQIAPRPDADSLPPGIVRIRIYDKLGTLRQTIACSGLPTRVRCPIAALPPGLYYADIEGPASHEKQSFIKE
jgi:pimeloyl-ACP methyl ester carboxylesterase